MKRELPKMKLKSVVAFALVVLFFLSTLSNLRTYADLTPQIYLTPSAVNNQGFSVAVFAEDLLGTDPVFAYQVKLFFNTTFLRCIGASVPQTDNSWIFSVSTNTVSPTPVISNTAGYALLGASILGSEPSVSGSGPFELATIDFSIKTMLQDAAISYVNLDNPDTFLLNQGIEEVPVSMSSGGSVNCVLPASTMQMPAFNNTGSSDSSSKVLPLSGPFPSDPSVSPEHQVNCHWWAGGVYPSTSTIYAEEVCMKIRTPDSTPSSSECLYQLLSVWDDNGSYDQIGFADYYSNTWTLLYSWTTTDNSSHIINYNLNRTTMNLSPGTEYDFTIIANNNTNITFGAWTGGTEIWSMTNQTGGNNLLIENYYYDKWDPTYINGYDYTVYEEVWNQNAPTGPAFNFLFYYTYYALDTNGSIPVNADYTTFGPVNDNGYPPPPSNVIVTIGNDSVLVHNTGVPYQGGSTPVFDMKTEVNGQFYVALGTGFLTVEMLFLQANLTGDQIGGTSGWSSIPVWPDENVTMKDVSWESRHFGTYEGEDTWNYMADIVSHGTVNMKDIAIVARDFGATGSYLGPLGITVTFNTGQYYTPNPGDLVPIPSNAASFSITQDGSPVGACITFWTP